jgi:two-component system chemotaxis sensor kinase CheA
MINLRNIYLEEAEDLFKQMEQSLLLLENSPEDASLIAEVFRSMHTLKGSSSMYGSTKVADFIHNLETIYDRVRAQEMRLTRDIIDCTLRTLDHLKRIIIDPEITDPEDIKNHETLTNQVLDLLEGTSDGAPVPQEAKSKKKTYHIYFEPNPDIFLDGTNPMLLVDELAELGKSDVHPYMDLPSMTKIFEDDRCYTSWDIILVTDLGEEPIKDVFIFVEDTSKVQINLLCEGDLLTDNTFMTNFPERLISSK